MGIILQPEGRNWKTRTVVAAMYVLLLLGAVSMVHPFLVMLSGSLKSRVDQFEFDVIPRFISDDGLLLQKYVEAKCNENSAIFRENYRTRAYTFGDLPQPEQISSGQLADWETFRAQDAPLPFYQLGFTAPSLRTTPRNVRAFRKHVRKLCRNDLDEFARRFGAMSAHWAQLYVPYENPLSRTYQVSREPLIQTYQEFKRSSPPRERIYLSCEGRYARFLGALPRYDSDIERFNELHGTQFAAFDEVPFPRRVPAASLARKDWEAFVRSSLNCRYILVDASARAGFTAFLHHRYDDIRNLNKNYGSRYGDFSEIPLPDDRTHASPALTDYAMFLQDEERLPAEAMAIDSPEFRWRDYLLVRHGTLDGICSAHGIDYPSLDAIRMPQLEADADYVMKNSRTLRWHFALRNYRTVIEYLMLYGRGILNTAIYCLLAVMAALLVNPIAAYALSRYALPSQYKILLFMMATMTFPPIVTAIPNFLILKDLGLLNTFAALILPGMANGYSIFLLKGFFDSLPRELYEAADIDGATEWQKFWVVTMNLSKPILAVISLGAFGAAYGNFMFAFIVCQDRSMWTLMVWLYQLQQIAGQEVIFASLIIAAIPTLLVFAFCQNLIIRGIVVPTEK